MVVAVVVVVVGVVMVVFRDQPLGWSGKRNATSGRRRREDAPREPRCWLFGLDCADASWVPKYGRRESMLDRRGSGLGRRASGRQLLLVGGPGCRESRRTGAAVAVGSASRDGKSIRGTALGWAAARRARSTAKTPGCNPPPKENTGGAPCMGLCKPAWHCIHRVRPMPRPLNAPLNVNTCCWWAISQQQQQHSTASDGHCMAEKTSAYPFLPLKSRLAINSKIAFCSSLVT